MKIAILGYNVEGRASYQYFAEQGEHELTICDQATSLEIPDGAQAVLGDNYLDDLNRFDLLVRTAGLIPQLILNKNPDVGDKITTHLNEFMKQNPTRNIIGVTGTKGKGTTSTLITKMLEANGEHVFVGGNIGLPPLSFLKELTPESWVVLELSSFQLIDLKTSPHIGVCLMVVPEHLNWHADIVDYVQAKSQLFAHQSSEDIAIYFPQNALSTDIASESPGQKIPYFEPPGAIVSEGAIKIDGQHICNVDEIKLLGAHNFQNACAAVTTVWHASAVNRNVEAMRSVLTSFSGLEHRLEFVRELEGVQYYNDSFGTTPETAMVALQAFVQPKIIILGGSDKGASYDELARSIVANNVRAVLLIGDQADRIQAALEGAGFTAFNKGGETMSEIVSTAHGVAQPGDVVLLSTACASFDMFKDYQDRGEQFKTAVKALA